MSLRRLDVCHIPRSGTKPVAVNMHVLEYLLQLFVEPQSRSCVQHLLYFSFRNSDKKHHTVV